MKIRRMNLFKGFTVFVLCISICTSTTNATVIWEDDFDDGNYDEWTVCQNSIINPPSNWSASDYYLQIEQEVSGTISHPSNVAYGKWSFDFKANETQITPGIGESRYLVFSFVFISNDINNLTEVVDSEDWSCYGFKCRAYYTSEGNEFRLSLGKWHGGVQTTIDTYDDYMLTAGWHRFDVTRTTDGLFSVYDNGSLVMQGVDTEIDTSELLVVSLRDWHMIDNIVVDDEVIPTPTPTSNPPPPPWGLIAIGGGGAVAVIVLVIVILRRR